MPSRLLAAATLMVLAPAPSAAQAPQKAVTAQGFLTERPLPLFRMNGEKVTGPRPHFGDRNYYTFVAPNMFAVSLLNLAPDTAYEARFVLTDPDGVRGKSEMLVTARTRAKPPPR